MLAMEVTPVLLSQLDALYLALSLPRSLGVQTVALFSCTGGGKAPQICCPVWGSSRHTAPDTIIPEKSQPLATWQRGNRDNDILGQISKIS